jgi:hypothetical protein
MLLKIKIVLKAEFCNTLPMFTPVYLLDVHLVLHLTVSATMDDPHNDVLSRFVGSWYKPVVPKLVHESLRSMRKLGVVGKSVAGVFCVSVLFEENSLKR